MWEAMYEPQTLMASRASQGLSGLPCRCVACPVSWELSKHRCLVVASKNPAVPELWAAQTLKGISNGKLKIRFALRPTCVDLCFGAGLSKNLPSCFIPGSVEVRFKVGTLHGKQ